ncbi:flagellin FlaB [Halomicrobium zhouii]|uniref:Flagellin n=1 Tax=Halomicrobium zhouii TaxID=767519 RepID=A0A1I6L4S0_9EURY|nr:archaellin/type IV pilin N-terminal domain-containing protein [Halomicrobium zhouii]SFR98436.1 flagellin FlaB [Halomicrobium zhouii]
MFEKIANNEDRGQVGIGTLIVFIAMVLVAAIAAGVLINTAGFLQSSAEETGQQSSSQVTDRLQVVSTVGSVADNSGDPVISEVEITVKRAPGADNVDLETTIAQWVDSSSTADLTWDETTSGNYDAATNFTSSTFQDDDSSISESNVLNDPADRAVLTFSAADISSPGIDEGETVTIKLNTQSGGTTTATISAPETLSGKSTVAL